MHTTLKMVEKLDDLLEETDEYIKCAHECTDNPELKSAYMDLARCHYDGFEKLSKCVERTVERKSQMLGEDKGQLMKEMAAWHMNKFTERAAHLKSRMDQMR